MGEARRWNLEELKKHLAGRSELSLWIVHRENIRRLERYFMRAPKTGCCEIDQDRETEAESLYLTLAVGLAGGRQGEISRKLFFNLPLAAQIDEAVVAARHTDHQAWTLPARAAQVPQVTSADAAIQEDPRGVMSRMSADVLVAVARPREAAFNSAELFLSVHDRELHLSNGLVHRSAQTRAYIEAAYSSDQDEFVTRSWGVGLADVPVEKVFGTAAAHAGKTARVAPPRTGKFAVLVDDEVLGLLFNDCLTRLSASNAYNGLPFKGPGQVFVEGHVGDPIHVTIDPRRHLGADARGISDQGVVQEPYELVRDNRIVGTLADKRHADYLEIPATASHGDVVVGGGRASVEELRRAAPQVLEVLQFSALFSDANSGTFSSEIRLALLHDNATGTVTTIKGGGLSGSFDLNFRGVRFSRELAKRVEFPAGVSDGVPAGGHGYLGPSHALLTDVSVVS